MLAATREEAAAQGLAVCIAVADRHGDLLAFLRMDGAPTLSIELAQDKAWSVCAFAGLPTDAWWELLKEDPALFHGITKTPRLVVFGGGRPVLADGMLMGAVGVSGATAAQDTALAMVGADSLAANGLPNA